MRKAIGILIYLSGATSAFGLENRILVFGSTIRPAHSSIIPLAGASLKLALEHGGFPSTFSQVPSSLLSASNYWAIILLDVSETIIDKKAQEVLEQYVRTGGTIVAIHASISAGKDWSWFQNAIGTLFLDHPRIQTANVTLKGEKDISKSFPASWSQIDEWYNFTRPIPNDVDVLATVDEFSYQGGKMGNPHPISWSRKIEKGNFIYIAMGHDASLYSNAEGPFMVHIFTCLKHVIGMAQKP